MPEIEKCALCGYSPMHLIRDGIDKISCCGLMCDALRWNHVQRSISSEKELLVQVKSLEDALQTIAEGRGMLRDNSTIYMNGRVPEVPTVLSRRKMQEIAKETLEEACRK